MTKSDSKKIKNESKNYKVYFQIIENGNITISANSQNSAEKKFEEIRSNHQQILFNKTMDSQIIFVNAKELKIIKENNNANQ